MKKRTKAKPKGSKIHVGTGRVDTGRTDKFSDENTKKDWGQYRDEHPKVPKVPREERKKSNKKKSSKSK